MPLKNRYGICIHVPARCALLPVSFLSMRMIRNRNYLTTEEAFNDFRTGFHKGFSERFN